MFKKITKNIKLIVKQLYAVVNPTCKYYYSLNGVGFYVTKNNDLIFFGKRWFSNEKREAYKIFKTLIIDLKISDIYIKDKNITSVFMSIVDSLYNNDKIKLKIHCSEEQINILKYLSLNGFAEIVLS